MIDSGDEANKTSDFTRAINAVLLELANILSEYRDSFVVSGGLAMHLLFGEKAPARLVDDKPEGGTFFARVTKDVDLVLNLIQLDRDFDDQAEPFGALLMQNLYQQESGRQFWVKGVRLADFAATITVPVEFLAPTPYDTGGDPSLLTRVMEQQDIQPAALDGVALGLLQPRQILLSGAIPDGRFLTDVPIQVVDPAMLILIKAIAFADRLEKQNREPMGGKHLDHAAKHAYDISQLLYRYPNGVDALVERLVPPYLTVVGPEQSTIDRALQVLREHFADRKAAGIRLMVREGDYLDEKADEDRKMRDQQGIVGRVRRLLDRLDARVASVY